MAMLNTSGKPLENILGKPYGKIPSGNLMGFFHGILMGFHWIYRIIMDYIGLLWVIMDYNGL